MDTAPRKAIKRLKYSRTRLYASGKPGDRRRQRRLGSMRKHEGIADCASAHLEEIAHVHEFQCAVETEQAVERQFRIIIIEPVHLMQQNSIDRPLCR